MAEPLTINHVSDTAFMVARYRAIESARADALFHDPYAARLAGEKGRLAADALISRAATSWSVVIRTVIIDDFIQRAIRDGVELILNLGAGLDTRPYRLDLPDRLTWIEADYADMLEYKQNILKDETPRCELERIAVDLASDAARRAFLDGIEARGKRTLVLTEGVVPYLSQEEVAALANDLRRMPHVEGWMLEYFSPELHKYRKRSGVDKQMRRAPFKFQPADWFGFFADLGWKPRDIRYPAIVAKRLGRPMPLSWNARFFTMIIKLFATRARRRRMSRLLGWVVLEPLREWK